MHVDIHGKKNRKAKVCWNDASMRETRVRRLAVRRAREQVGNEPGYTLFARTGDSDHMNCESFVRLVHGRQPLSSQSLMYKLKIMMILSVAVILLLLMCIYYAWDPLYIPIVFVTPVVLVEVLNTFLESTMASTST